MLENCHPPGRCHAFLLFLARSNFQARLCILLGKNEGLLVVNYEFSCSYHCGPGCQYFEGYAIYGFSQEISWFEFHALIDLFPVIRVFLSKTQPSQMSDFIQVYTKNSLSFFLVCRVKRARHEMTTRMTGEAFFSSWAAALIWRVSSLRRSRMRALPSLIRRKRETVRRLFLLGPFSLNSCKVAFFSCSDVDTPDCAALKLIDFGRSIDMKLFPAGTTFSANCYTEDFQCIEMKEGRAWTTQVPLTSAT